MHLLVIEDERALCEDHRPQPAAAGLQRGLLL